MLTVHGGGRETHRLTEEGETAAQRTHCFVQLHTITGVALRGGAMSLVGPPDQ